MKNNFILSMLIIASFSCLAQSDIILSFHMGLGVHGKYEIGGTVKNNSSKNLSHSAITYIIIDKNCVPSKAMVFNLGPINANRTSEFRIPIEGPLSSYRILSVSGWSSIGVPVVIDDKTADTIKKREREFMNSCGVK